MTRQETVKLFGTIAALFPRDQSFAKADGMMVDMWSKMLSDVPFAIAQAAALEQASISPFPPAISEIRRRAAALQKPELRITADEAWAYAIRAVRKYGYSRWPDAAASMPEAVAQFVKRFGYRDICMSESADVVRGQFMRAWENSAARKREKAQTPTAVLEITSKITTGLLEGI